ncbi:MAG: hypothetical protein NT014_04780 [Candidatus Omnitrophica bacterium]|nr:hypothetical protein [Candidatus Omnitrophota bacterium]
MLKFGAKYICLLILISGCVLCAQGCIKSKSVNKYCPDYCNDDLKQRVGACRYPERDTAAYKKCLDDARQAYDGCCGSIGS